jgi:hypothetical protein
MWQIGSINVDPLFVSKINFPPPGRKSHPSEECHLSFSLSAARSEGSYIIGIPSFVVKPKFKLFFEFLFNFISGIYNPNAAAAQGAVEKIFGGGGSGLPGSPRKPEGEA